MFGDLSVSKRYISIRDFKSSVRSYSYRVTHLPSMTILMELFPCYDKKTPVHNVSVIRPKKVGRRSLIVFPKVVQSIIAGRDKTDDIKPRILQDDSIVMEIPFVINIPANYKRMLSVKPIIGGIHAKNRYPRFRNYTFIVPVELFEEYPGEKIYGRLKDIDTMKNQIMFEFFLTLKEKEPDMFELTYDAKIKSYKGNFISELKYRLIHIFFPMLRKLYFKEFKNNIITMELKWPTKNQQ